jgi:hypothetical protein
VLLCAESQEAPRGPARYRTLCPPTRSAGLEDMHLYCHYHRIKLLKIPLWLTSLPMPPLVGWKSTLHNDNNSCEFPRSSFALSHGIYYGKATSIIVLSYFYSARTPGGCLGLFHFIHSCRIIGYFTLFALLFFSPCSKLPGFLFIELLCLPPEMLPRRSMPAYRSRRLVESSAFRDRAM